MKYTISSSRRIIARIFDYLMVFIVVFLFFFILNIYNLKHFFEFFGRNNNISVVVPIWCFYTQILFMIIYIIFYFIFIPAFYNGQTLGKKMLKIFIIKKNLKEKLWIILIKREFFLSLFFVMILIIILISTFFIHIYDLNFLVWIKKVPFLKTLIPSLYFINSGFIFFILLSLILSKSGVALHDIISNSYVGRYWQKEKLPIKKNITKRKILTINQNIKNIDIVIKDDEKSK